MTDEEYRQFLAALARKHVKVRWRRHLGPEGGEYLRHEIHRLASTARFVKVASERVDEQDLLEIVAREIKQTYVSHVTNVMEEAGVLDALEEAPDITFGELRRAAIPDDDLDLLRLAGVEEPEAEITVVIQYTRKHVGKHDTRPLIIVKRVNDELQQAAETLASGNENSSNVPGGRKKRKILNGIGKILSGTIAGAGNLLLATGTIAAPNPATAYAVIGSSALAVGSICQGMGDLRGE